MKIKLTDYSCTPPKEWDKEKIQSELKEIQAELSKRAASFYANKSKSLLIVLQGMDASGKDGSTLALLGGLSPEWFQVASFKKPSEIEMAHDYLWRIHQEIPPKGKIGVFNRSHYEDILIPSVYKTMDIKSIKNRYKQINQFETYLQENEVVVLKFYLHISKERQKEKLIERIEESTKWYKHSDGDWETRKKWDSFRSVYESILTKCNQPEWHIIPCDSSLYRNYCIAKIVLEELKSLNLNCPELVSEKFSPFSFQTQKK